ncbi:hypothetical protein IEE94_13295 [Yimella sp. cx-573]|nr:hypothetical protein [Yimella sp. cx-573]
MSDFVVRELKSAVAFRANADLLWSSPDLAVEVDDLVDVARAGRDR